MSVKSYLKFLISFVVIYAVVRIALLGDEFSFYTVLDSLLVGLLAVAFTFVYERIRNAAKRRKGS